MITLLAAPMVVQTGLQTGPLDLILNSGLIVKLVLLCLLGASALSWGIIFTKFKSLKTAKKQSTAFLNTFWYGQDLDEVYAKSEGYTLSPVANVFKAGFKELKKLSQVASQSTSLETKETLSSHSLKNEGIQNISRALYRATLTEMSILESRVSILATIGSATPFVGLFGTVWGIMNSFQGIGATGAANLSVVAPGISEALIATAVGLAAAIPAVIAYNFFVGKIKSLATDVDTFSQDFLNLIQRSFLKE